VNAAWATVTNVDPLYILIDGSQTDSPALAYTWYSPVIGDRVVFELVGQQLVVKGTAT
jgi:hypothetical protein